MSISLIHPSVKVWAYSQVLPGTSIGRDSVIGSNCYVGRDCKIGQNVRIQHGCFIPNGTIIGDHVFIGPNVTLTDDKYPVSGNTNYLAEPPIIEDHVSIGAGAVILPGLLLGRGCLVGAGSVVTKDIKPGQTVMGVPARVYGEVNGG
jgi:acetyltransferase-like isoleucine patch superfamily enzyme